MKISSAKLSGIFYHRRQAAQEALFNVINLFNVRWYLIVNLALNICNWLFVYVINLNVSQRLVVLHYNVNLGVNLIGDAARIYIIPGLGLIFILINFLLVMNVYKQGKFIIHLILASTVLNNIFLLAATAAIYLVNFR